MKDELLAYLSSVSSNYPYGIPSSCLQLPQRQNALPGPSAREDCVQSELLIVIQAPSHPDQSADQPFRGAQGELMQAAIVKGLQLRVEQVSICFLSELSGTGTGVDEVGVVRTLTEVVERAQPRVILMLGSECSSLLTAQPSSAGPLQRGSWFVFCQRPCLASHAIGKVLESQSIKREFWEDLKKITFKLQATNR